MKIDAFIEGDYMENCEMIFPYKPKPSTEHDMFSPVDGRLN